MAKRVTIPGLTVREAQVALLDALYEGIFNSLHVWPTSYTHTEFNDRVASFALIQEEKDLIMEEATNVMTHPTTWKVTEGVLRLAAAAKRKGGRK